MKYGGQPLSPTKPVLALLLEAEYHAGWAVDLTKYGKSYASCTYVIKNIYSYYGCIDYTQNGTK